MLKSQLKLLLVLLLLIALPLRGLAASGMLPCKPNSSSQIQTDDLPHDDHATHHHAKSENTDDHSTPDQPTTDCTDCAPCCLAAALISHAAQAPIPAVSNIDFPAFTEAHHSALVQSLDHPPKFRLM